jgi:hypothetical protein
MYVDNSYGGQTMLEVVFNDSEKGSMKVPKIRFLSLEKQLYKIEKRIISDRWHSLMDFIVILNA